MNDNFYIFLPSTSSANYYSDNTTAKFTTKLQTPLNLIGQWDVALSEIHLPSMWFNVSDDNNTFLLKYYKSQQVVQFRDYVDDGDLNNIFTINMDFGRYNNFTKYSYIKFLMSILNELKNKVKNNVKIGDNVAITFTQTKKESNLLAAKLNCKKGWSILFSGDYTLSDFLYRFFNLESTYAEKRIQGPYTCNIGELDYTHSKNIAPHKIYIIPPESSKFIKQVPTIFSDQEGVETEIKIPSGFYETRDLLIKTLNSSLPAECENRLKFSLTENNKLKITSTKPDIFSVRFNKNAHLGLGQMLGLNIADFDKWLIPIGVTEGVILKYPIDLKNGVYGMYIYSDIVQQQFVGDKLANLLRIVKIDEKEEQSVNIFTAPYYLPVSRNYITDIHIEIKTGADQQVIFYAGTSVCKLHFKKRN